ncbi:hypothetical protein [Streptomyces piniterrae]|uniref:hypothetical protein n=1 Tax=Streptomyces piniterrae TaxID=2571125 RepID=UPI00145CB25E
MPTLDPNALAEIADEAGAAPEDVRPGVQPVDDDMIREYVIEARELPEESARPFAQWLNETWFDFSEEPGATNGEIIAGALADWRGQWPHPPQRPARPRTGGAPSHPHVRPAAPPLDQGPVVELDLVGIHPRPPEELDQVARPVGHTEDLSVDRHAPAAGRRRRMHHHGRTLGHTASVRPSRRRRTSTPVRRGTRPPSAPRDLPNRLARDPAHPPAERHIRHAAIIVRLVNRLLPHVRHLAVQLRPRMQ